MSEPPTQKCSLIEVFTAVATDPTSASWDVIECAHHTWTYRQLDIISTGLAIDLHNAYGPRPTVAFLSENHPYMLALMLATWKLGGIIAPYDPHAPEPLLKGMMEKVSPACIVTPSTNTVGRKIAQDLGIPSYAFEIDEVTMPALWERFANLPAEEQADLLPPARKDDIAIYIFTSGASSVDNLKPVPLSQESIYYGSVATLSWLKKTYLGQDFGRLRALGWAPWTFLLAFNCDLGAFAFLSGGCYVFALIPTTYAAVGEQTVTTGYSGLADRLLPAVLDKKISTFSTVPLILEGFMAIYNSDDGRREQIRDALRNMKAYMCGGAKTSPEAIEWAIEIGLPLNLGIGMTELGHPLCCTRADDKQPGWPIKDCFIHDVELVLMADGDSHDVTEGELHIRSKLISKGYHNHDSSAFSIDSTGVITFQTGDVYERIPSATGDRLLWKGRKEDYIQMASGEVIDPRIHQSTLDSCEAIARSCLIGNNFLQGTAQHICAIIQPGSSDTSGIFKAIAAVNRNLIPSLRIAWSRTLILAEGESIPINRKGLIFRKKLQTLFGERLANLQSDPSTAPSNSPASRFKMNQVSEIVRDAVSAGLGLSKAVVEANAGSTFAELGMDSKMAVVIVNTLNRELGLNLPPNTCHNHIDLQDLTRAVSSKLNLIQTPQPHAPARKGDPMAQKAVEVVIVGEAVRLPGDLNTPSAFWNALVDRRNDLMTEPPPDRWDHASFYTSCSDPKPGEITFSKSGFVEISSFDNAFFGISGPEALNVSPSARIALETAFEALEGANIPTSKIRGSDMAVYVATGIEDGYSQLLFQEKGYDCYNRYFGTGVANSAICGRLSYLLDVHGPSVTVDTACSGGLVAFDCAVDHLLSGKGESALVCAVSTHSWPGAFAFLSAQRMSSINSRCAAFTSEADGFVPSDGAVALVLKTREAAVRDGDNILGIVKSTGVKHDGRSQGLIAPNINSQVSLQRSLLADASMEPSDIDFLEAHGTGTTLGDLIETQGISQVFHSSHSSSRPLIIGAAKTCVGHTENAAGLVGVVKTLLSFEHDLVPGLVHLTETNFNPNIDCTQVPILIPITSVSIPRKDVHDNSPYRALVLANGFAGTVAGTILEASATHAPPKSAGNSLHTPMLFVLSAKTQLALLKYVQDYLDFCTKTDESNFQSVCYTSCVGREHYKYRFACVARSMPELIEKLESELSLLRSTKVSVSSPRPVLGFPGQGAQYQGMAHALAQRYPRFRTILSEAAGAATSAAGFSVLPYLIDEEPPAGPSLDASHIGQICTFVYQYAMYRWLEILGVQPQGVIGHSLGEIPAAVASGAFCFDFALGFMFERAKLLSGDSRHPGAMAAVACTEEALQQHIETLRVSNFVTIAVYNSNESHVVSGKASAVDAVVNLMKEMGVRAVKLKVDQGFHSPCIDHALPALETWLSERDLPFHPPKIPFFSSMLGDRAPVDMPLGSSYWVNHAKKPVRFDQAAKKLAEDKEFNVVVDVGPQPFVWTALQNSGNHNHQQLVAACAKQGKDQDAAFLGCLASLFESGVTLDFTILYDKVEYVKMRLPTYPWQRERHYPAYIPSRKAMSPAGKPRSAEQLPQNKKSFEPVINGKLSDDDQKHVENEQASLAKHLEFLTAPLNGASASHNKSREDVQPFIISCIKDVLELGADKELDLSESLVSYGIDSIAFTQIRARVMKEFGVDVPMVLLSDAFTLRNVIRSVSERVGEEK